LTAPRAAASLAALGAGACFLPQPKVKKTSESERHETITHQQRTGIIFMRSALT
jgi:hypothetical protein